MGSLVTDIFNNSGSSSPGSSGSSIGTVKYTDDAYTTLATTVGPTDTTLTVTSSSRFANLLTASGDYFFVTLRQTATGTKETVRVTNMVGTTWTVVRAVGPNDSNLSFAVGDGVYLRVGTNLFDEIRSASNQSKAVFAVAFGAVDAFSASVGITPQSLVDGMQVNIRALGPNLSATPTLNLNSLGAYTITKKNGSPLWPGDINGEMMLRYVAAGPRWELLNPSTYVIAPSYAIAAAMPPTAGQILNITSEDGGLFYPVFAVGGVTYASDGNGYCGAYIGDGHGNAWKRVGNSINVKHYGAKGDGVTDDTATVQRAISSNSGNLHFPAGTYNISASISLTDGIRLIGDGCTKTTINQTTANMSCFIVANDNEICHFRFCGTGTVVGGAPGREVIYGSPCSGNVCATNISVHDNLFDSTISTSCVGGNNLINWLIYNNQFQLSDSAEHGIYISAGSNNVRVSHNTITKSASNGLGCNAINIKGSQYVYVHDNQISGAGWDGYGVVSSTDASSNLTIANNTIYGLPVTVTGGTVTAGAVPIRFGSSCVDTDIIVTGNVIDGGYYGIQANAKNVLVSGNKISNASYRGIECNGDTALNTNTNLVVQDNFLFNCASGIRVYTAFDGTYVSGNTCVGSSGTVGIEYNNGSTVGSVSGNSVHGFTTNYLIGVTIPCDAGAPFTPNFTGLTTANGTGSVTQSGWAHVNGNLCSFTIALKTSGTATTASTAGTTHFSPPFAQSDSTTLYHKGHGIVFDPHLNPTSGIGIVQQMYNNQEFYTPTWSATNDDILINGSYSLF